MSLGFTRRTLNTNQFRPSYTTVNTVIK